MNGLTAASWDMLAGTQAELSIAVAWAMTRIARINDERVAEREGSKLYQALDRAITAIAEVAP